MLDVMNIVADLHMHTTASDGLSTAEELFRKAQQSELKAIAICDHDVLTSAATLSDLATQYDVATFSAIELSCSWQVDGRQRDVHLLGYAFNQQPLEQTLQLLRQARIERACEMLSRLRQAGVDIQDSDVPELSTNNSCGRPHIAQAMVKKGLVKTIQGAFDQYLGTDHAAYVPLARLSLDKGVQLIQQAGGIAVLAHPGRSAHQLKHLEEMMVVGVDGLEVFHPSHNANVSSQLLKRAKQDDLLITAGSDYHGFAEHKRNVGSWGLQAEAFDRLWQHLESNCHRPAVYK